MGSNIDGKLGVGDLRVTNSKAPCLIERLSSLEILDISCGGSHTLALDKRGSIYSWGLGEFGVLGTGRSTTETYPVRVNTDEKVI